MINLVAVDTSVLVGLLNPQDHWHQSAVELCVRLESQPGTQLVIFDCVIAETISVICRRLEEKRRIAEATDFLEKIETEFPPQLITWILPELPQLYTAVVALIKQTEGRLNFNDSLIALCCQRGGIHQIASFDADFDLVPWLERLGVG